MMQLNAQSMTLAQVAARERIAYLNEYGIPIGAIEPGWPPGTYKSAVATQEELLTGADAARVRKAREQRGGKIDIAKLKDLAERNTPRAEIAAFFMVNPNSVSKALARLRRNGELSVRSAEDEQENLLKRIIWMRGQGYTVSEIAQRSRVSAITIKRRMRELRAEGRL